jgi:hypothetical protein
MHPAELLTAEPDELLQLAYDALAELQRRYRPKPEYLHLRAAVQGAIRSLEPVELAAHQLAITHPDHGRPARALLTAG